MPRTVLPLRNFVLVGKRAASPYRAQNPFMTSCTTHPVDISELISEPITKSRWREVIPYGASPTLIVCVDKVVCTEGKSFKDPLMCFQDEIAVKCAGMLCEITNPCGKSCDPEAEEQREGGPSAAFSST